METALSRQVLARSPDERAVNHWDIVSADQYNAGLRARSKPKYVSVSGLNRNSDIRPRKNSH
jgi:hypothetical protein